MANVGFYSSIDKRELKLQPGQYVVCIYDNHWWIGNISVACKEEHDSLINFMHSHGTTKQFHWPLQKNICWLPEQHILMTMSVPTPGAMGRHHSVPGETISKIENMFHSFQHRDS